jgi:hypothetical protein
MVSETNSIGTMNGFPADGADERNLPLARNAIDGTLIGKQSKQQWDVANIGGA